MEKFPKSWAGSQGRALTSVENVDIINEEVIIVNFKQITELYLASGHYNRLSAASRASYKTPIRRLVELGGDFVPQKLKEEYKIDFGSMPKPVAVALDDKEFWEAKLVGIDITNVAKNYTIRVLHAVYLWAEGAGILEKESLRSIKAFPVSEIQYRPLAKQDFRAMDGIIGGLGKSEQIIANMIEFQFWTGLRNSEARKLKWKDISQEDTGVFVRVYGAKRRGEGQLSRIVKLTDNAIGCLEKAKKLSPPTYEDYVFTSARGNKIHKDVAQRSWKTIVRIAGLKGHVMYDARRGTATGMCLAGYTTREIADLLGHKDERTTSRYIRPTMKQTAERFTGF